MAELVLLTLENDAKVQKILVAANYAGVAVTVQEVTQETLQSEEFLAKSPSGKLPVLETPEGPLFETNAILRYVGRLATEYPVYGASPYNHALVDSWIDWARNEVELPAATWLYPIWGLSADDAQATTKAKETINALLRNLHSYLITRTYLVGESVTLADIAVAFTLLPLYTTVLDKKARKSFINVNRWLLTIVNQPIVKSIVGDVELCEVVQVAQAVAPVADAAPVVEAAPVEEPAKPAARPDLSYLRSLPNGTFNLNEWKTKYANAGTTRDVCPWFWENFDNENWVLYHFTYNYADEQTVGFKSSNLLGGYLQRLDGIKAVRSYCFASAVVLSREDGTFLISGAWLWKGQEIPQEIKDVDDTNYYTFNRIDPTDEAQRQLIDDYFCWEGDFGGLGEYFAGKNFAL